DKIRLHFSLVSDRLLGATHAGEAQLGPLRGSLRPSACPTPAIFSYRSGVCARRGGGVWPGLSQRGQGLWVRRAAKPRVAPPGQAFLPPPARREPWPCPGHTLPARSDL